MGSNSHVLLGAFLLFSCSKAGEIAAPPSAPKDLHEPKRSIDRPTSGPIVRSLPDDVRRLLIDETAKISDRVDPLMRRKDAVLAIAEPAERREKIDALRDEIGALASELEDLLDDSSKPWAPYRRDPAYTHCFQQFQSRFDFYTHELADLKRRSAAALEESKPPLAFKR